MRDQKHIEFCIDLKDSFLNKVSAVNLTAVDRLFEGSTVVNLKAATVNLTAEKDGSESRPSTP
jgi:hypothetical protein